MTRVGSVHMRNLKFKTRYICQIENIVFHVQQKRNFREKPIFKLCYVIFRHVRSKVFSSYRLNIVIYSRITRQILTSW
jgi:hypothetical protein